MIKVEGLHKSYGDNHVLRGIDLALEKNEIFGLLGPNGAGKTTMLEIMEGLREREKGHIDIMGKTPDEAVREGILGVQLQSSSLPEVMTPLDAMTFFCRWRQLEVRLDLLRRFGLERELKKPYKHLSTGQKRRLHLALALAHEPQILFLDEPTAGLDVEARVALHEDIKNMKKNGLTMVLASHDMAEVESLCDRVGILVQGRIKKIGSPRAIVEEVAGETIIRVKLASPHEWPAFSHVEPHGETPEGHVEWKAEDPLEGLLELLGHIKGNDLALLDITLKKQTLEERFIEIAKEDAR